MLSLGLTYNLNQINIFVRQNRKSTPIKSIDLTSLKNVHCMICRTDYHWFEYAFNMIEVGR